MDERQRQRIEEAAGRVFAEPKRDSYLPMEEMERGGIYRIIARNFFVGVWDGESGFIGIREKFGDRYLFTEYHRDYSDRIGTARPVEKVGQVPEGVQLVERLPPICPACSREVDFLYPARLWVHTDDGSSMHTDRPTTFGTYLPLFDVLVPYAEAEEERWRREQ